MVHNRRRFLASPALFAFSGDGQSTLAPVQVRAPYHVVVGTSPIALTTSGPVRGISLQALCPGQQIFVGINDTVSSTNGWPMADGDTLSLEVSDAAQIWIVATSASQRVAVLPYRRN